MAAVRVLVACHPRPWNGGAAPHWQRRFIEDLTAELRPDAPPDRVEFVTADVLPGGDLRGDVTDPCFLRAHRRKFHLVFLPDCGGAFYDAYTAGEFRRFVRLLRRVRRLLVDGGHLCLGKFTSPELAATVRDAFGGAVRTVMVPVWDVPYLIIPA